MTNKYQPVECPECGLDIQPGELQCTICPGYDAPFNPLIDLSDFYDDDDEEEIKTEPYSVEIKNELFDGKNHDFEFVNDDNADS